MQFGIYEAEDEEAQESEEQREDLEEEEEGSLLQGEPEVSREEQTQNLPGLPAPKTDQWVDRRKLTGRK